MQEMLQKMAILYVQLVCDQLAEDLLTVLRVQRILQSGAWSNGALSWLLNVTSWLTFSFR